ncbi:hypothetical protein LguiA_005127 [Lonicera macranthoides]
MTSIFIAVRSLALEEGPHSHSRQSHARRSSSDDSSSTSLAATPLLLLHHWHGALVSLFGAEARNFFIFEKQACPFGSCRCMLEEIDLFQGLYVSLPTSTRTSGGLPMV